MKNGCTAIVLHTCCGPCASACVPALKAAGREVTMLFANSNIDTREEFEKRLREAAAGEVVLNATDATSKLQVGATFELSGGTLVLNVPAEVDGAAFIRGGATLTHSIMGDTRNKVTAWNRVDLTVNGDLTVEQGGEINTVRKGWSKDAFVFNPERSNEIPPKLGRLHWRLPGLRIIVR